MEMTLQGSDVLIAQFLAIPERIQKQVEKECVTKINKVAVGIIHQESPADTGTLRKSIGSVVRSYKRGRIVVGIIGPRNEYSYQVQPYRDYATKKGTEHVVEYIDKKGIRRKKKMHYITRYKNVRHLKEKNPAVKYAHLVERGTKERFHKSGKSTGRAASNEFMNRSLKKLEPEAEKIFADAVKKALNTL
jgi:hypothetical protein